MSLGFIYAKEKCIYSISGITPDQNKWNDTIFVFDGTTQNNYTITVLSTKNTVYFSNEKSYNGCLVGKFSVLAQNANLTLLGTKEENPEYFL